MDPSVALGLKTRLTAELFRSLDVPYQRLVDIVYPTVDQFLSGLPAFPPVVEVSTNWQYISLRLLLQWILLYTARLLYNSLGAESAGHCLKSPGGGC